MTAAGRAEAVFVALAFFLSPAIAACCPSCGPTDAKSQAAYRVATGFLASLPLLLIAAGGIWGAWVARRRRDAGESAADNSRSRRENAGS